MPLLSRRQFVSLILAQAGAGGAIGCGTILHPERRGQAAGPLDWKIVALDGIGLLLFFVPGVIAFAVDFSNGSIYLPESQYSRRSQPNGKDKLLTIKSPRGRLTVPDVETLVSQHSHQPIELKPGTYRTMELEHLDDFWPAADRLNRGEQA